MLTSGHSILVPRDRINRFAELLSLNVKPSISGMRVDVLLCRKGVVLQAKAIGISLYFAGENHGVYRLVR